ncbi:ABC transporter permease [Rhodovastum atsumiense]|uniref:ABC transporter permease n=2 Tax=Rhodovastum atsumiense TaxID=504468 RepID=A0A5M6IQ87_9PROT|nr:ABC transporter permease [Rhodovastum atsumiense]
MALPSARLALGAALVLLALLPGLARLGLAWLGSGGADPLGQDLLALNLPPGTGHVLGTDHLGRDVLARLTAGTWLTLSTGLGGTLLATLPGAALGLLALTLGGVVRAATFAAFDLLRVLPGILLALLTAVVLGNGSFPVMLALGLSYAPLFAELVRAAHAREMASDYVAAAQVFGQGRLTVLGRHVLPNLLGPVVTLAVIVLPRCIVTESVLSFLGLGTAPDQPSWGRMIADASGFAEDAPHAVLAPMLALSLLTLGLSLLGESARRHFDPLRREAAP